MMMPAPMKRVAVGGRQVQRIGDKPAGKAKTTGERTQVNARGYLDSFAPDTVLLRVGTPFESLNMFISKVYDETVDTCRKVLMHMPPTPLGQYMAMRLAMDDDVDVPIRRIAFAMLYQLLGIHMAPVQFTRLPKFSDYKAQVGCMISAYEQNNAYDHEGMYAGFKSDIIGRLPLRRNRSQLVRDAIRDMHALLGYNPEGQTQSWFEDCLSSLEDNTKRYTTCSRNYYSMNLREGVAPAAEGAEKTETDGKNDEPEEHNAEPEVYVPDAHQIDMMNDLAMECIQRIASGRIAISNAAARCTILLFVSTVRNAAMDNKAWPSRQELDARINAVKGILRDASSN